MSGFVIAELAIPKEIGAEGWGDFVAMTDVRNEVEASLVGTRELAVDAALLLPRWLDPNDLRRLFVARIDGSIVARGTYEYSLEDAVAWLAIEVVDQFSGRGIGSALYDTMYEIARAEGKTVFQSDFFAAPDETGPQIASPSGFGAIPADSPGARFAVRRGYGLEMVLRYSRLPLPIDPALLDRYRREAELAAGDDYRVVRWEGPTPELWLEDLGALHGRMFTDAPHGDLDMGTQVWDGERQRALDENDAMGPRAMMLVAVEHLPTGRLVGFNELMVPPELDHPIAQRDTLVLSEHRGHRLGMLMKVDNLLALQEHHPGHSAVVTANAEENRFMLDVNDAVGFAPMAYSGVWKLEVD